MFREIKKRGYAPLCMAYPPYSNKKYYSWIDKFFISTVGAASELLL